MQITDKTPRPNYKLEIELTAAELHGIVSHITSAVEAYEMNKRDRYNTYYVSDLEGTPLWTLLKELRQLVKEKS